MDLLDTSELWHDVISGVVVVVVVVVAYHYTRLINEDCKGEAFLLKPVTVFLTR